VLRVTGIGGAGNTSTAEAPGRDAAEETAA
jgi:hypothetical protein